MSTVSASYDGASIVTGELAFDISETVPGDATAVIVNHTPQRRHDQRRRRAHRPRTGKHHAAATSTLFTIAKEPTP